MDFFKGKTVLVTGATGLIGSRLVNALMAMGGMRVIALSRDGNKLQRCFTQYAARPDFETAAQDAARPLGLEDREIDVIFHAAGPIEGRVIAETPVDVIAPNLLGTVNCLELLRRQAERGGKRGRLVLFSSVTVYKNTAGEELTVTEADTGVTEALDAPGAPYSQSKRMAEVIARAYGRQFGTDTVIARLSTVYGGTMFPPGTAFFEFVRRAMAGEDLILNSQDAPRRDNIYVEDAVSALLLLCRKGLTGEAYNVSSNGELGNYAAVDEIAEAVARAAGAAGRGGREIRVIRREGGDGRRKPGLRLDNARLKSLGWSLRTSLEQGVAGTLTFFDRMDGSSSQPCGADTGSGERPAPG